MKSLLQGCLASLLIMQPLTAADVMSHWSVTVDVYVRDDAQLCEQAFELLRADHSPAVAEAMISERGARVPRYCLVAVYQAMAGGALVSAGVDVRALQ